MKKERDEHRLKRFDKRTKDEKEFHTHFLKKHENFRESNSLTPIKEGYAKSTPSLSPNVKREMNLIHVKEQR